MIASHSDRHLPLPQLEILFAQAITKVFSGLFIKLNKVLYLFEKPHLRVAIKPTDHLLSLVANQTKPSLHYNWLSCLAAIKPCGIVLLVNKWEINNRFKWFLVFIQSCSTNIAVNILDIAWIYDLF